MKSQEAAFRIAKRPAKKVTVVTEVKPAGPKGVKKNKSRNDRRKNARKTASLIKAGQLIVESKKAENAEKETMVEDVAVSES